MLLDLAGSETEAWDLFRMDFKHRHAGNVLCGKLISAENHMREWNDDHDKPNIDINGLWAYGAMATTEYDGSCLGAYIQNSIQDE